MCVSVCLCLCVCVHAASVAPLNGRCFVRLQLCAQVIDAFITSERVCDDDLPLALSFPDRWSQHIVLRQWLVIPPQHEFRAFVFDGQLTAVSQYFKGAYFPDLVANRDVILVLIQQLWSDIRDKIPVVPPEFVLDLCVDFSRQRALVIELNPFGRPDGLGTGCCLFRHTDPTDCAVLFGEDPFEFRVETAPTAVDLHSLLQDGPLKTFLRAQKFIAD